MEIRSLSFFASYDGGIPTREMTKGYEETTRGDDDGNDMGVTIWENMGNRAG